MALKLNLWQAPNGFSRIYLNGLPVEGKAWLQGSRGSTVVQFERGSLGMPTADVLALVSEAAGCDATRWNDLLAAVEAAPKPKRGGQPGRSAASRRGGMDADAPAAWTAADAALLDPNDMAHPLTEETTIVVDDR